MVQLEKVSASHPRHWLTHTRHSQCVCAHVWVCVKHIKPHTQKHTHTHTDHSLSLWISHKPLLQSCFHIRFLPHGADGKQTVCWYIYYFTLCVWVCVCVCVCVCDTTGTEHFIYVCSNYCRNTKSYLIDEIRMKSCLWLDGGEQSHDHIRTLSD